MLALIAQGSAFGFTAGTSFGPLHTLLMTVTLTWGWRQGLLIVLSPLLTDLPIIAVMLFVLDRMPPAVLDMIRVIGGLAVLWIAWGVWRQFRAGVTIVPATDAPEQLSRQTILKGMTVNFLNPGPYIFWGTITGPILLEGLQQSVLHGLVFIVAFYGTFLGIMAAFVILFDRLRTLDPRITQALSLVSVVVLVALGASLLWDGLT